MHDLRFVRRHGATLKAFPLFLTLPGRQNSMKGFMARQKADAAARRIVGVSKQTEMSLRKRVTVLWLLVAVIFGAFNAVFWPVYRHQQAMAPENFLAYAQTLYAREGSVAGIACLMRGIAAQHPPYAEPYETLHAWLSEAGRAEEAARWKPRALFYAAFTAKDFREALGRAIQAELRQNPVPPVAPTLIRHLEAMSMDFAAALGVREAAASLTPEERLALLRLSSGAINTDGQIGGTGVKSPVDILVQSGGGEGARRLAHIVIQDRNYAASKRGLNVVLADSMSGQILERGLFDIWESAGEADRLTRFLRDAPPGCIGAFAVFDDASANLSAALEAELLNFGLERQAIVARQPALLGLRYSFAAIGIKGAAPGAALQAWTPDTFQGHPGHPVTCGVLVKGRSGV